MLGSLGCGSVRAGNSDVAPVDAAAADEDAPVADAPAPRCDPSAPFGPVRAEVALDGDTSSEGAMLTNNELVVWYSAIRGTGSDDYDIFQASRANVADAFGNIRPVANVNTTTANERGPQLSPDGRRLYATIGGGGTVHMKMAVRNPDGTFGTLMPIPGASDPQNTVNDGTPYPVASTFAPNDAVLYYHSDTSGKFEIYRIADSGAGFRDPQRIEIVGLAATDAPTNPVVTRDEKTLYFKLANDVWTATRASALDSFHDPVSLPELSGTGLDAPSWVSDDNCLLYVSQQVPASTLAYKIYYAARPAPVAR